MSRERIRAISDTGPSSWRFKKFQSATRGLFGTSAGSLPQSEQNYLIVSQAIQSLSAGKEYQEITLKQLSHFFVIHYEFRFKTSCLDYNWFNFQETMKKLRGYLEADSWVAVAEFIYSSFEKCIDRRFSREKILTLSSFKRSWYVEELLGKSGKFDGFY